MKPARVTIVAGSRLITNYEAVAPILDECPWGILELVSGAEPNGVDAQGERWAAERWVPVTRFPADWSRFGKYAGPARNARMARYAQALVLIWFGDSPGSANMLRCAENQGLCIHNVVLPHVPMPPHLVGGARGIDPWRGT